MYALVDANNFYASCERVFRPDLKDKAIIVLSNNDGCVIARSQEVKDLGIPMGEPFFKCKDLIQKHDIQVFSSNFTLYGDLSSRLMRYLQSLSPYSEVYSIDECFLHFSPKEDFVRIGANARAFVQQALGLPISIGFGRTKTLAKLANRLAKKEHTGVYYLSPHLEDTILAQTPIDAIWGLGKGRCKSLETLGIYSAKSYKEADPQMIKKRLHTPGAQIQKELSGIPCLSLETQRPAKQSILSSRSFGSKLSHFEDLKNAVITNTLMALEKLRKDQQVAQMMYLFIQSSRHHYPYYKNSVAISLSEPSADTLVWVKALPKALKEIYKPGILYAKSGVLLTGLQDKHHAQQSLFAPLPKREELMRVIDEMNKKWGKHTLTSASLSQESAPWKMSQTQKSPAYTTKWEDLVTVKLA